MVVQYFTAGACDAGGLFTSKEVLQSQEKKPRGSMYATVDGGQVTWAWCLQVSDFSSSGDCRQRIKSSRPASATGGFQPQLRQFSKTLSQNRR